MRTNTSSRTMGKARWHAGQEHSRSCKCRQCIYSKRSLCSLSAYFWKGMIWAERNDEKTINWLGITENLWTKEVKVTKRIFQCCQIFFTSRGILFSGLITQRKSFTLSTSFILTRLITSPAIKRILNKYGFQRCADKQTPLFWPILFLIF